MTKIIFDSEVLYPESKFPYMGTRCFYWPIRISVNKVLEYKTQIEPHILTSSFDKFIDLAIWGMYVYFLPLLPNQQYSQRVEVSCVEITPMSMLHLSELKFVCWCSSNAKEKFDRQYFDIHHWSVLPSHLMAFLWIHDVVINILFRLVW